MKIPSAPLFVFLASAGASFAQGAAEPAAASGSGLTLMQYFDKGGPLMWVLLFVSVLALANVCWLFFTLRAGVTAPRAVVHDVMDKLRQGDLDEARKVCDYRPCPFSHVAMAAIDASRSLPDDDPSTLTSVVEGEGARQAARLQSRSQWLLDLASIAPMIGLLGTVLGMLATFQSVNAEAAQNNGYVLADGVSLALITTVAGLLIAIPCMCFYAWYRRQASKQVAALECLAADLVMVLLSRRMK